MELSPARRRLESVARHLSAAGSPEQPVPRKTCVITGCTSGLGRALAEELMRTGNPVVGCGRRAAIVEELNAKATAGSRFDVVDITDPAAVQTWANKVRLTHAPDLLVANAGVAAPALDPWRLSPEQFDRVIDVNVKGVMNLARAFLPDMIARGRGVMVSISSGLGHSTNPKLAPYSASKFAVEALTKCIAQALPAGMAAVPLAPGVVQTEMNRASHATPIEQWVKVAAPFFLALGPSDSGRSLIIPEFYSKEYQDTWILPAGLGISSKVVAPE